MRLRLLFVILFALPRVGFALELSLPGNATLSREIVKDSESYQVPIEPFSDGRIPALEVEGAFRQEVWRLETPSITTLQILDPLRSQLIDEGFDILLDCAGRECGGFDFRFATRVMPAPDMFVDLFDYRFLSARNTSDDDRSSYLSILVSRSGSTGYIQVIHVNPSGIADLTIEADVYVPKASAQSGSTQPIAQALLQQGHVILSDLRFESGSSDLGEGPFLSLQELAAFLLSDPALRIALVGHTDTIGGLEPNGALSKRRATSVLERLATAHDVPRAQMDAEGMGYLSPIAPNLSQDGRQANRRVEAVLLNSE